MQEQLELSVCSQWVSTVSDFSSEELDFIFKKLKFGR